MAPGECDWGRVGKGDGNPRVSQLVPEKGRGSHARLGPGPCGATRARTHAPSPSPRGKKRRRSHAVGFTFLPKQSHDPAMGLEKTNYSEKLRQRTRRAGGGQLPSSGAPPLGWEVRCRAALFALYQPESAKRGFLPSPRHTPQTPGPGASSPASQSPAKSSRIPPSSPRQLPAAGQGGELGLGVRGRGSRAVWGRGEGPR